MYTSVYFLLISLYTVLVVVTWHHLYVKKLVRWYRNELVQAHDALRDVHEGSPKKGRRKQKSRNGKSPTLSGSDGRRRRKRAPSRNVRTLIFADVDDTIKPGGGRIYGDLAGKDPSYTHTGNNALYPGMARFLYELSKLGNPGVQAPEYVPQVNFLTGRVAGNLEELQAKVVRDSGVKNWGMLHQNSEGERYKTLNGSVADTGRHLPWHKKKMFKDYGETKYQNIKTYLASLRPAKFRIFIFGDNGQGDVILAKRVLADPELSSNITGIFIHEVDRVEPASNPLTGFKDPHSRVVFYHNVIDLLAKIDRSPVEATFSADSRAVIERVFLAQFSTLSKSPAVHTGSPQFLKDSETFTLISPPARDDDNGSKLFEWGEKTSAIQPRQPKGSASTPPATEQAKGSRASNPSSPDRQAATDPPVETTLSPSGSAPSPAGSDSKKRKKKKRGLFGLGRKKSNDTASRKGSSSSSNGGKSRGTARPKLSDTGSAVLF